MPICTIPEAKKNNNIFHFATKGKMKKFLPDDHFPIDILKMRPPGFQHEKIQAVARCCDNVTAGKGWFKVLTCPGCGSARSDRIMIRCGVNIVQCLDCSLGFAEQFPVDSRDVYCHADYLPQAEDSYLKNIRYRIERFAGERIDILLRWLDKKPEECALLDIGCGTGWFLEAAREKGFSVFGQELGKDVAAGTSERLGIQVWSCPATELKFNSAFDAITLFDVLEHTSDPLQLLTSVRRMLKPGGIVLIFVPNLHSVGFSVLEAESALVSPAEHLLYFTRRSMEAIAVKAQLQVLDIKTRGMDIPDIVAYYRDVKKDMAVTGFLSKFADIFQAAIDASGYANHMRTVARKEAY
jgi:2-polyprenyl-3-methyl-5-hydroxy-6-metoxy-1,4-benzoquinol methylase